MKLQRNMKMLCLFKKFLDLRMILTEGNVLCWKIIGDKIFKSKSVKTTFVCIMEFIFKWTYDIPFMILFIVLFLPLLWIEMKISKDSNQWLIAWNNLADYFVVKLNTVYETIDKEEWRR